MSESTVLPLRTAVRHTSRHDAALNSRNEGSGTRPQPSEAGLAAVFDGDAVSRNCRS